MFKPTPCLQKTLRRLPLSPKQAGKEYYKGNRVGSMGTIDRYGRFHPDFSKIRTYVYPKDGLAGFELTPFVSPRLAKNEEREFGQWAVPAKTITGEEYLVRWKREGGSDQVEMTDTPEVYQDVSVTKSKPEIWEEPARSKN